MLKGIRLGSLVFVVCATAAWGQKPPDSAAPTVAAHHDIPTDKLGNVIRVSGKCNPKTQDTATNGHFEIRFPRTEARGVQTTSGTIAISGAVIQRSGVAITRMIKSSVDYVTVNKAANAVEFSTRSQEGVLKLPLVAEKDAQVVVLLHLETVNGSVGFRYFLTPRGLSSEPVKKKEGKKGKN